MPRRVTATKTSLIKQIVDIDVALATRNDLTPEQRQKLQKKREHLERRIYK